ncbi:restriction endonuclease [Lachnospiraceae bacterium AM48-27BH]|nr:restriction endonuclease [Lachnospiraceae bacterium AM48-27BH]
MRIDDLKKQTKSYLVELNQLRYKIKELYSLFPDLEDYDDYEDSNPTPSDTSTRIDDAIWFVLSDAEKNQIILNNYINRHKTKWEIGRDYELYVGYKYQCLGYSVDYFGINNGINDLGRDLIISQNGEIGIVQCKYWSSKKQIHEKHIAQLYGTVVSYIIEHNYHPELVHGIFITNISLSETAKKFASYLDIKYKEHYEIGDFPRIKCNIGKDEYNMETKIYHLPTDQQYDSVKINQPGECFVFTTDEAEKLGFRRAFKWHSH